MDNFKIENNNNIIKLLEEKGIDIDYCCKGKEIIVNSKKEILDKIGNIKYKKIEDNENISRIKSSILKRKSIAKLGEYHFQKDLEYFFNEIINKYPDIASYENIGKSVENRNLLIMKITQKNNNEKNSIMYLANIHGNETIGREICLYLINYLCEEYQKNNSIKNFVNNTNIYIMPTLNPDGFENKDISGNWNPTRFNSNNIDLNRDFPDQYIGNKIKI